MAKNTAVRVLDDLTGDAAAETVGFGLDGIDYDIDLSFANADALRELLQRYADAGRRTGGRKRRPRIVPGAKRPRAKATPKTTKTTKAAKPVAGRRTTAKAATPAKTTAKATPKAAPKTTAKAEPAKTTRTRKAAEPKKTTRATARKVPGITFSAAEHR
ncbi:histone-like nucleoid-structuring protein Lsr2 [Amycolatopsis sp. NPDC051061]|uniref:Lsr2 dimerization domain-containing protein n=1 Tax=Amycolatopsis sp. NPDC051061 TaxID=3155042 RepID=UPI00341C5525